MGAVISGISGEVDVPLAVQKMQLGGPELVRIGAVRGWGPDYLCFGVLQVRNVACLANDEIADGGVHVIVETVAIDDPRVGAECQQRIGKGGGGIGGK